MASSIVFEGTSTSVPGVYGRVDGTALGGGQASVGNLAVAGAFPFLPVKTPIRFTNSRQLLDFDPTNKDLALLARLAFAPSTDDEVPAGANSLTLLNVQPSTQAFNTVLDTDGGNSILVKAKLYGPAGNRTYFKMVTNADVPAAVDIQATYNGVTEEYAKVESGPLGTITYTGDDLTTVLLLADPTQFKVTWTRALAAKLAGVNLVDVNTNEMIVANTVIAVSIAPGAGAAHDAAVTVKIEGLDETGAPVVGGETVSFAIGAVGPTNTTNSWSRIDQITVATADAEWVGIATLASTAFDFPVSQLTVGDVLALVNQYGTAGFEAEAVHVRAGTIPATEIDATGSVSIKDTERTLRADTWAIVQRLARSNIVVASRAVGGTKRPAPSGADPAETTEFFLLGGSITAPVTTQHWIDALPYIATQDIQVVALLTQALAVIKAGINHCRQAALLGNERNLWAGYTPGLTLQQGFDQFTSLVNSKYVSLVGQQVQVDHPLGGQPTIDPEYAAVMLAAMQCGTDIGTPLTLKRPDVLDVVGSWDGVLEGSDAIDKGIVSMRKGTFGWEITRSVTTHLSDDNPFFTEVSTFASLQTSVRDLRAGLIHKIGSPIRGATSPETLRGVVAGILDSQVDRGLIKGWRNVILEDRGDRFRITYECAPIEPLNFIEITAFAVRIAA